MQKIKKFIECLLPVTACNLKCSYCYVIQEGRRKNEMPHLKYSPELIGQALNKKRLGGTCYISICGAGETLIPEETIPIVEAILKQGHYVNVTTNGTISKRFDEIISLDKSLLKRLQFAFSFHYLELLRTNNLDIFFENINKVKSAGCSFLVQINLCDDYEPYLDTIKDICLKRVNAYPQVAVTRDESNNSMNIMTKHTLKQYYELGKSFDSKLFEFTMKNFMVKRNEFCYAGEWAFSLNLSTGELRQCYFQKVLQNIFEDIEKPIKCEAVGCGCNNKFCTNSSHFMALGVIPQIETPTYFELRNREGTNWYSKEMSEFLNSKLYESNEEYSDKRKMLVNYKSRLRSFLRKVKHKIIK